MGCCRRGAGIAASAPDAQAVARRDPGCCQAEYLDQPVSPYTVDEPLHDGQILGLGDADWQVVRTPGHTPGHLSLWQPEERLVVVGDALSDYDVGWVNLALDGPEMAATALASLQRLADLAPGCGRTCPRGGADDPKVAAQLRKPLRSGPGHVGVDGVIGQGPQQVVLDADEPDLVGVAAL
jgi:hydroxyacylglutathione hydrolase